MSRNTNVMLAAFAIACFSSVSAAQANSFGLNFTATRFGGGPYPIATNELAGLIPQSHWNNVLPPAPTGGTASINSPVAGKMVDNFGNVLATNVSWINANAEVNSDTGNTTPNERLYRGVLEGNFFQLPSPQLAVTVSSIPYSSYNLIVYLQGFSFDADASVKVGNQEYYYHQSSNFTKDGFLKATATTFDTRTLATYAEFDGLTSSSVTMEMITRGGNRASIAGFQVVSVPEPNTWALLITGSVLLMCVSAMNRFRAKRSVAAI